MVESEILTKICTHPIFLRDLASSVSRFIFFPISDEELEKRRWFRFLKIVNIVLYVFIILAVVFVSSIFFDDKSALSQATVECKDGTTWSAIDKDGRLLGDDYLCGLCTKRKENGTYTPCSRYMIGDYDSDSFKVVSKKHRIGVFTLPLVYLVAALILLKLVLKSVIYVIAGKK